MQVRLQRMSWEFTSVFRIAYQVKTHSHALVAELSEGDLIGRGEAIGVSYRGETIDKLVEQLRGVTQQLSPGVARAQLQALLPAGGARNALDCALWDLEAKSHAKRAWELAGLPPAHPLLTTFTLGLDTPAAMARAAAAASRYARLKIKLNGEDDLERVDAIRNSRPDALLLVDANQAWSEQQLRELAPRLARLGVALIEQPLPVGKDAALAGFRSPIPLCADESCQTSDSLPDVVGKYQYVNIKLDKTGGLTEALRLADRAQEHGLKLMVGCMGGSSLSMAPAFVVGQMCEFVDLDAPLLTKGDMPHAIVYEGSRMLVPEARLWG
jgi:L-Ala-D/L-Glu epimerase